MGFTILIATVVALLLVGGALVALLLRAPARTSKPPYALVAVADQYGLDLQGWSAAGRVGRRFVHLDLTRTSERLGYRQRHGVSLRIDGPMIPGLEIRARRATDLIGAVRVDEGRFDQHVWITSPSPTDAVSRMSSASRAAILRVIELGGTYRGGAWRLTQEGRPERARSLLKALLAAANGLDADGSLRERLERNASSDPVLEVRVANAAHRLRSGELSSEVARQLASVLVEGLQARPPVRGAGKAMDRLRALRAGIEVGRVSVASVAGGEVALVELAGGQVALADEPGGG